MIGIEPVLGPGATVTQTRALFPLELTRFVGHGFLPFHAAWSA